VSDTTRYAVLPVQMASEHGALPWDDLAETITHAATDFGWNRYPDMALRLEHATWLDHDPRLPSTPLVNAARAAAVELRDIARGRPSSSLLRIADNLESALQEAHDD
jgi:hypothetical protein